MSVEGPGVDPWLAVFVCQEKGQVLIQQLTKQPHGLSRIKLKVLGSTGVGKSLLIESLKCGFLGSFFRRRLPSSTGNSVKVKGERERVVCVGGVVCVVVCVCVF